MGGVSCAKHLDGAELALGGRDFVDLFMSSVCNNGPSGRETIRGQNYPSIVLDCNEGGASAGVSVGIKAYHYCFKLIYFQLLAQLEQLLLKLEGLFLQGFLLFPELLSLFDLLSVQKLQVLQEVVGRTENVTQAEGLVHLSAFVLVFVQGLNGLFEDGLLLDCLDFLFNGPLQVLLGLEEFLLQFIHLVYGLFH